MLFSWEKKNLLKDLTEVQHWYWEIYCEAIIYIKLWSLFTQPILSFNDTDYIICQIDYGKCPINLHKFSMIQTVIHCLIDIPLNSQFLEILIAWHWFSLYIDSRNSFSLYFKHRWYRICHKHELLVVRAMHLIGHYYCVVYTSSKQSLQKWTVLINPIWIGIIQDIPNF